MQEPGAEIARLLRIRRVAEMMMIEAQVGPRSRRSIFRDLKRLGYRTSFTHNGRYYTLEDIPRFDPQGLWFYEDVGFSRFGTLKQTVAELVPRAPEGRTHGELAALLRVRVHNTLLDLVESGALGRRIVEGAGEFVYLSPDPTEADRQIARRLELLHERTLRALPPDETVLAILCGNGSGEPGRSASGAGGAASGCPRPEGQPRRGGASLRAPRPARRKKNASPPPTSSPS